MKQTRVLRFLLPLMATTTWAAGPLGYGLVPSVAVAEESAKAGRSAADEKKPVKSKDFYLKKEDPGKYEQLARQKRGEAIEQAKGILASGNLEDDQLASMNMRLAELYWETAKDMYLTEMASYLEVYGKWADSPNPDKATEPREDHRKSQEYNRLAIDIYRTILQKHRNYPQMDQVYFNLAFNLMDLGEKQQALEYYQTLVKNYPQSEFVADAYLAMGEHFFDNNNAFKALGNYKKASTYTDTKIYVFALYKLGWCYYNVGEYAKAIDEMKEVISKSDTTSENGKLSLKEEALNDLVLFYSELGDMDAAYSYFSRFGEPKYYKAMLKRLAGVYMEQGKHDEAITTYRKLIAEEPKAKDAPGFQNEVISAFFKSGRKDETIAEIDRLAREYGPGSAWALANASNQEALDEANGYIEKNLRQVAVDYHKEARKTSSKKTYELTRQSYQKYLALFPSNKYSYDIRFAYAEVLYELKSYEDAAGEYEKVVALDKNGKYFQVAASSLILTIDKILGNDQKVVQSSARAVQVKTDDAKSDGAKDPDVTPKPLGPWEERKVKACELFANTLPDHKDSPNILYEAARLLYDHHQFAQSSERFLTLIDRYGKEDVAEISANLLLDSYNQLKDWDKVDRYARQFYANANFKVEFKKELHDIYEKASFKKIEQLEQAQKMREAGEAYVAFVTEFPASSLSDRALFNGAVDYFKAGDVRKSIELRQKLLAAYPKSEFTGRNLDALGKVLESIADYGKAADYYEQLAAWDKGRTYSGTADALYNAGLFRDSLGDWQKAITNYQTYARDFASREDSHLLALEVGRIYDKYGKRPEAAAAYKRYFSDPALAGRSADAMFDARLSYGRLLRALGQGDQANTFFQESVALYDRMQKAGAKMEVAPLFVAEMRFYMVEPLFNRFARIKLELPKKGARGNALDEKLKLMEEVAKAYNEVLALKQGEWGIAALFQIGEAYRNLADTILAAPTPPELKTPQQIQIYRAALEDKAFPLKDKAAEALEQALYKSYELGIYNQFTARAASLLAVLRPKEYPVLAEKLGTSDRLSDTLFAEDFRR